jgi:hypothetical protein
VSAGDNISAGTENNSPACLSRGFEVSYTRDEDFHSYLEKVVYDHCMSSFLCVIVMFLLFLL